MNILAPPKSQNPYSGKYEFYSFGRWLPGLDLNNLVPKLSLLIYTKAEPYLAI